MERRMNTDGFNEKINVVIIDDEAPARKAIRLILNRRMRDRVNICKEADDMESGLEALRKHRPDVLLLDINLRDSTGFELLKRSKEDFKVIFITAYEEFAIEAFQYSAIDYILKPIDEDKLVTAVQSAYEAQNFNEQYAFFKKVLQGHADTQNKLVLKTTEKIHIVEVNEIIRCEADVNYTRFYIADGRSLIIARTLKEYELLLSSKGFVRVHRRHLINLDHLHSIRRGKQGYAEMNDGSRVSISPQKREELMMQIGRRFLDVKVILRD
ncbi:MAG: response regulator transcription factor [Bacteroidia bacterium]|nr:response regulator transcription factor [Bacteroidia bacterium]